MPGGEGPSLRVFLKKGCRSEDFIRTPEIQSLPKNGDEEKCRHGPEDDDRSPGKLTHKGPEEYEDIYAGYKAHQSLIEDIENGSRMGQAGSRSV